MKLGTQLIINDAFSCFKPIENDLTKLYHEGKGRIWKKLDLIKIVNDIQYLKLLTKIHLKPSVETQFQIHHCKKSLIDLDTIVDSAAPDHALPDESIKDPVFATNECFNPIDKFLIDKHI